MQSNNCGFGEREENADFDAMTAVANSGRLGLGMLMEKFKATTSPDIASCLIGVITDCRRSGPVPSTEAVVALVELLKTLELWRVNHRVAANMLFALHSAIYEEGLPEEVDFKSVAEFIQWASCQDPLLSGPVAGPVHQFSVGVVNVCSSLAVRGQLISVLATRPGAKEEMIVKLESILRRLAEFDKPLYESYGDEARFVIEYLRTSGEGGKGCP